jgi:hypothetical protein
MSIVIPELPLAAASRRLRGRPGRPRKVVVNPEMNSEAASTTAHTGVPQTRALSKPSNRTSTSSPGVPAVCPDLGPRLVDIRTAAKYLSIFTWSIRDLESAGALRRIRLPLASKDMRKLLFDRRDLDRLVDTAKDSTPT